jgi:urease accessory protein
MRIAMGSNDFSAASDAAALARALQFGDSVFPIGAFSFSCGLESAVQKGSVTDTATLCAFTRTAWEQAARGDGIALIAAYRAAVARDIETLLWIDEQVYARKLSSEMRKMTVRLGKKFTEMGVQVIGAPLICKWRSCIEASTASGCYPVALAMNFALQGLPARAAFTVHQYGLATTILGAALRLMRISHVETQKILYELNGRAEVDYQRAAAARLSDMSGYAPLTDIMAAVHARAHVRLFMS